jgi:hypothetical protein
MNPVTIFIIALSLFVASSGVFAEDNFDTEVRYLHVQKGQTLHNIVRRLYPERKREWGKISQDIIRLNPHAFPGGDPAKMKAGVRLNLPKKLVMRSEKERVGNVISASGSVVAVDMNKVTRKLGVNQPIYLGDKIITGEDGAVRLQMIDQAVLDLRCYSIMVIEQYALKPANRSSIINLLQGSLRKVTGTIGDLTEDVYELKTPLASVGVRGTEYALRVFQAKGCGGTVDAEDGMYIRVIDGLVDIKNKGGQAVFARGDTAYVALPDKKPVKKKIAAGIIEPNKVAPKPLPKAAVVEQPEEEGSNVWWWLLGILAVVLVI